MQVDLDDQQMGCVAEFSLATGRSMDECLYEALDDWIRTVAQTICQTEKFNVVVMLPTALSN